MGNVGEYPGDRQTTVDKIDWITPDWPAPPNVSAVATFRSGGLSAAPYDSFNLGDHVGDSQQAVNSNRKRLSTILGLPAMPHWLRQVHGNEVVDAAYETEGVADASFTTKADVVCAVLTADCLPLLLCDRQGSRVAAVHVGWRGLAAGVIEAALSKFNAQRTTVMAWCGPAIGPQGFIVGEDVREVFLRQCAASAEAFQLVEPGRWSADIVQLARQRLNAAGVYDVYGGHWCTWSDPRHFFSYRRDGVTGRMASLIWLKHAVS